MKKPRVGVVGFRGYSGEELLRLLLRHTGVDLAVLYTTGKAEEAQLPAWVPDRLRGRIKGLPARGAGKGLDFLFTCTPNHAAGKILSRSGNPHLKAVDLSADYRLPSRLFAEVYGAPPGDPRGLAGAVYGLSEWNRERIRSARITANPGCYPTASLLLLIPLAQAGLLASGPLILDAKSGVTGAGRKLEPDYLFGEVNEDFRPYGLPKHRHQPEIRHHLKEGSKLSADVLFIPHLIPAQRGILITAYLPLRRGVAEGDLRRALQAAYVDQPFVRVLPAGRLPRLADVRGTNLCLLSCGTTASGLGVLFSALDNLGKGAAGQAVQNMNLMLGFPETQALD